MVYRRAAVQPGLLSPLSLRDPDLHRAHAGEEHTVPYFRCFWFYQGCGSKYIDLALLRSGSNFFNLDVFKALEEKTTRK